MYTQICIYNSIYHIYEHYIRSWAPWAPPQSQVPDPRIRVFNSSPKPCHTHMYIYTYILRYGNVSINLCPGPYLSKMGSKCRIVGEIRRENIAYGRCKDK